MPPPLQPTHRFAIVLIKPSRYDDDGYVIQWWRTHIPAHGLAVVWGIVEDAAARQVLGPDVAIEVTGFDEVTTPIRPRRLLADLARCERALIMVVGVQTNQFPRALDLARPFRAAGHAVAIGGFHVSGTLALTPDWEPGRLRAAREAGITLYAGELENGVDTLLRDAWAGRLKPLYDRLGDLADLDRAPLPKLVPQGRRKVSLGQVGMDIGRGCPFTCTFCSIIAVAGNTVRARPPEAVEAYLRQCVADGARHFLVVDDNFARVREWKSLLDVFARLNRDEGAGLDLFFQLDAQAHRIPGFVDRARQAGCSRVFIGVESVRDDNLAAAGKRHNKIQSLKDTVMAWKRAGIIVFGTLIVGFPHDTPDTLAEDVRFLQEELPVDLLIVSVLTPLPGSADHQRLVAAGAVLDEDLNRYGFDQPVSDHPRMSRDTWGRAYRHVWDLYYTPAHIERIFARAIAFGLPERDLLAILVGFCGAVRYENVHPYMAGLMRRKVRRDRRPGLPLEPRWRFYPRRVWETVRSQVGHLALFLRFNWILWRARRNAARGAVTMTENHT